jgi:hypothetical protein
MGGGKSKKQTVGYRYFMGWHVIMCYGKINELLRMKIGERGMYRSINAGGPDPNITVSGDYTVTGKQELFGGEDREGGVGALGQKKFLADTSGGGSINIFTLAITAPGGSLQGTGGDFAVKMGDGTEIVNDYLDSVISGQVPAYRKMAQIIFKGFYFGQNPYIKDVAFQVVRLPNLILGGTFSAESDINGSANPVQIMYEVLTNLDWGMGYNASDIDIPSFQASSTALFDEGFGMSLIWSDSTPIEDFITEILKHINGSLFLDGQTGLFVLKLVRDDYTPAALPLFDEANIVDFNSFSRKTWGETINELTVVYTQRSSGKAIPITVQDMGNIQVQGTTINQKTEYPGIANEDIAIRVAQRDLSTLSNPLARAKFKCNREAWDLAVGDPFRLSWVKYGITEAVFRIGAINYGTLKDGHIIIDAIEDVFGLPTAVYSKPQASGWVEPLDPPEVPTERGLQESNYWDLVQEAGEAAAQTFLLDTPDDGFWLAYCAKPTNNHYNFQLLERPNGTVQTFAPAGESASDFAPSGLLEFAMPTAVNSTFTYTNGFDIDILPIGELIIIDNEYMMVHVIDQPTKTISVMRGILDTIPKVHAQGSTFFGVQSHQSVGVTQYTDGELVDLKFITKAGLGTLDENVAAVDVFQFAGRAGKPWPPGNLQAEGLPAFQPQGMTLGDFNVTWSHRDKTLQTGNFIYQDDGDVGPEAGTTYTIRFRNEAGALVKTVTGIAGTSYDWTTEEADSGLPHPELNTLITIELESVVGGESSFQPHQYPVRRADYGYSYGMFYGGYP